MKKIMAFAIVLMLAAAGPGFAFTSAIGGPIEDLATSDNYMVKFPGLILDGVYHVTEVPYELVSHPYNDVIVEKDYFFGLFTGLTHGIHSGLGKIVKGTYSVISAPIPGQHGDH